MMRKVINTREEEEERFFFPVFFIFFYFFYFFYFFFRSSSVAVVAFWGDVESVMRQEQERKEVEKVMLLKTDLVSEKKEQIAPVGSEYGSSRTEQTSSDFRATLKMGGRRSVAGKVEKMGCRGLRDSPSRRPSCTRQGKKRKPKVMESRVPSGPPVPPSCHSQTPVKWNEPTVFAFPHHPWAVASP